MPAERGPAGFSEIAAAAEFSAWTAAGGSGVLVLGVFRKPTIGDLFSSFKSVARKLAKSGEVSADVALYAQSRYDGKTKKCVARRAPLSCQRRSRASALARARVPRGMTRGQRRPSLVVRARVCRLTERRHVCVAAATSTRRRATTGGDVRRHGDGART